MNRLGAGFMVGLGLAVWWYAGSFPGLADGHPGPALFPRMVAAGLVLTGILLFLPSRKPATDARTEDVRGSGVGWLRLGGVVAAVVLFPVIRPLLGFIAALSIVGLAVALILKTRLKTAVPTVLVATVIIYWLFTGLLGVPL